MKKWNFKTNDKTLAVELAKECSIDQISSLLLVSKGICDPMDIEEFLSNEINLCDPYDFCDIEKACQRIEKAVNEFEPIAIFGDYDCDGITSTALLYSVLCEMQANVQYRVPSRDDGYGISTNAIDDLNSCGVKLIITVDNGISAFEAIDYAKTLGIDVVVTDHHIPGEKLPDAYAIVNPKREDCFSDFKEFAGVGVAFMVASVLAQMPCDEMLYKYGDLVAIGTIADVMPLVRDNRSIVKCGLNLINRNSRPGIKALIEKAGLKSGNITSTNIAFGLAPRINASGRMLHPKKAVELLLCDNYDDAIDIAEELNNANVLRQKTEQEILESALNTLLSDEKTINAPVIVVSGQNWHHGVIGIVAAKLVNIFSKPAIVFSEDETEAIGSCRSYNGVSIYDILSNSNYIEKFGGHESAAGLTVKLDNIQKAIISIQNSARKLYEKMPFDTLDISCKLNPNNLSLSTVYSQRILEPFGCANELPVFALTNVKLMSITELSGGKHLRLTVARDGNAQKTLTVMAFFTNINNFLYKIGSVLNLAVTIDSNEYKGNENLTIILKDIKPANININDNILRIRDYQNFKYFGITPQIESLTREDVAVVYKIVRNLKVIEADETALCYLFSTDDYCKIRVILDVLYQLEFINLEFDGKLRIKYLENSKHKDLNCSEIFNTFN